MKSPSLRFAITLLALVWMFAVIVPYYLYHRPFDGDNVLGVANTLRNLLVVAVLFALAAALGHCVLRRFLFESSLEALVIESGVGYGLLALIVLALAWFGLAKPTAFWILVVGGLAVLYRHVIAVARRVQTVQVTFAGRGERALAIFVGVTLVIALVFALTPPTGWDALAYHLPLPKEMLDTGTFPPASPNVPFSYPSQTEMLFLLGMALSSDIAAQVTHWVYLALTVGTLLVFCGRYFTRQMGWLASAFLVSVPSILLLATYAYNDLALMFYLFAAFLWTCRAIETQRTHDYVLAGILAGLTLGEKYTALIVPVALGALVLIQDGIRRPTRRRVYDAVVIGLVALVPALPWFWRNLAFYGNPLYPFGFGGLYWDAFRAEWFSRFGTGLLNSPLDLVLVPFTATVRGIQGGDFDATIGALLLALVPFAVLPSNKGDSRVIRYVAFVACVLFAFWLLGVAESKLVRQTRLLFPAFPLLAILAAEGWERLAQLQLTKFSAQRFATLIIALALGANLVSNVLATVRSRPLEFLTGTETREEFLGRNLGAYFAMAQWVNANLRSDASLVSLWEPREYYVERSTEPDAILDRLAHLQYVYHGDAEAIFQAWRNEGYTHVILFREGLNAMLESGYDPVGEAEMRTLEELEAKHLHRVYGESDLNVTSKDGKPALLDADTEPYAVYEIK